MSGHVIERKPITIVVDAMGGDHAPEEVVAAACALSLEAAGGPASEPRAGSRPATGKPSGDKSATEKPEARSDGGEPLHLLRRGPGGREPLAVQVGDTLFALRRVEAECIEIEPAQA